MNLALIGVGGLLHTNTTLKIEMETNKKEKERLVKSIQYYKK